MKETILKMADKKYWVPALLAVLIVLQLANITRIIVCEKKSCHSDEIFSYSLANSFYEPYLDTNSIRAEIGEGHEHNFYNWISADVIREYVTVQKGEQFRYDSVWYNQSMDRHPPLYYAVMHTICSFFPDTFSFVFGYAINFVCFIVTQIFLYRLSKNILKSKYLALTVCIFWGFSPAAADMTIFIRMYCMLAMWGVIFLYLHSKLLLTDGRLTWKQLVPVMAVTLCGALTQYLFLFLAFVTAVMFCIRYLCRKQFGTFFLYGFSVLGAVCLAFLIYPAYLPNMFAETSHTKTHFWEQFVLCIKYLLDSLFPVTKSGLIFWIPTLTSIAVSLIVMSIPVLYLFRDKEFVKTLLTEIKSFPKKIKNISLKNTFLSIWGRIKNISLISWIILISIVLVSVITAYTIAFASMLYVDRYLFVLYPLTALFIVLMIYFFISWSKYKKQILSVLVICMTLIRLSSFSLSYTFASDEYIENIRQMTKDTECIFVVAGCADLWMMDYLPADLYDADRIFVTDLGSQEEYRKQLEDLHTDKPIYLFLNVPSCGYFEDEMPNETLYHIERYDFKTKKFDMTKVYAKDFEEKYTALYKNLSITKSFEYIGRHTMFKRLYLVYRLA